MLKLICTILLLLGTASSGLADATIPTADKAGSKDNPIFKRYEGSFIVAYEYKSYDEFTLPLSKLEPVEGKRDNHNNQYFEPNQKKTLEGAYTRLIYLIPENRSQLEVLRNYQDEIERSGGKILFECKGDECGGDPNRMSYGGGGKMSLSMYLYPEDRITDPSASNGRCAISQGHITNQRYTTAEIPESGAYLSVLAYTVKDTNAGCNAFVGRTIAVVDIIEAKTREKKMVTIEAGEMAKQIASTGSVALYGIFFDFNKADIKPESEPTLDQIAMLLREAPELKLLVVGHTDNVGTFSFNKDLSERRAISVVNELVNKYGISKNRLTPVGVSFASPVASNKTEEGRAKNRRVELVEN
ncbi:MAG: OmpA family protein [Thermodesulfobacteriota bacterium]